MATPGEFPYPPPRYGFKGPSQRVNISPRPRRVPRATLSGDEKEIATAPAEARPRSSAKNDADRQRAPRSAVTAAGVRRDADAWYLYTAAQAASLLSVSDWSIRSLARRGVVACILIDGTTSTHAMLRFRADDLREYIAKQRYVGPRVR